MQDVGGTCSSTSGAPSPPASPPHHRWNVSRARRSTPREALVVDAAAAASARAQRPGRDNGRTSKHASLSCCMCVLLAYWEKENVLGEKREGVVFFLLYDSSVAVWSEGARVAPERPRAGRWAEGGHHAIGQAARGRSRELDV